jgi:hypothetical protein
MSTLSRTSRGVVVSSLNRGHTESNRVDHYHRFTINTEQRGIHFVKSINAMQAGLGYSRDYLTTSDREALGKFLAEHGQVLVDFDYESDTEQVVYSGELKPEEIHTEQFPIFVSIQNAGGAFEIIKVLVTAESCCGVSKVSFQQYMHDDDKKYPRCIRFVHCEGTNNVDLVATYKIDLPKSAWFHIGDGSFTKGLNEGVAWWTSYNGHHFIRIEQHVDNIELPLSTFGMTKRNLINGYCDNDRDERYAVDINLLKQRRTSYSIPELCVIQTWATTSHDDCVVENPEDYTPLQVHTAQGKKLRHAKVVEWLELVLEGTGLCVEYCAEDYRSKRLA